MLLGYTRVSTQEQASDERNSLEVQERVIRGYAQAEGFGAFEVQVYSDPGISGGMPLKDRPGGGALMQAAKKGDTVIASKLDRMFRSALDALRIADIFKEQGIDLIFYEMGTSPVNRSGMSECFFTMAAAFAQLERAQIRDRVANGRKGKKDRGGFIGGLAPYGYAAVGEGRTAMLKPVEAEQEIIKFAAQLPSRTRLVEVKKLFDEKGYVTRKGTPFMPMQIKRVLKCAEQMPQCL
jgi:DNA invertase Pin-like site-specific DNA recombinase